MQLHYVLWECLSHYTLYCIRGFDFENNYQFMVAKPLVLDLKAITEQSAMNVCFRASKDFSNNQDRKC